MSNKRTVLLSTIKTKSVEVKPKKGKYDKLVDVMESYFPNLYLDTKQVPDLKGVEVGSEITMVVKGKVTSHSLRENVDSEGKKEKVDQKECYDIKVLEIGLSK